MSSSPPPIAAPAARPQGHHRPIPRLAGFVMAALVLALGACSSGPDGRRIGSHPPVQGGYKVGVPYQIRGVWYYPKEDFSYNRTGIASWYGHPFHGRTSASGERYDMEAMTAAHKTLPMPSLVEVTNLENGRTTVLRVNDRGPFVSGRIIDVSRAAARRLGFKGNGIAKVRVRILEPESRRMKQLAMSNMTDRARALAERRQRRGGATPQLATRAPERRAPERRAREPETPRYAPVASDRVAVAAPARVEPVRPGPVRPGPVAQAPMARAPVTKAPADRTPLVQRPADAGRTARKRSDIRVVELPPTGAATGATGADGAGSAARGSYKPRAAYEPGRAGNPPAASGGPGRIAGRRDHVARPQASVVRAARPAPPAAARPAPPAAARPAPARQAELPGKIFVQAGAFRDRGNAYRMRSRLAPFGSVRIVPVRVGGARYFRVRVGPVASARQGNRLLARVVDAGYPRAQIVID